MEKKKKKKKAAPEPERRALFSVVGMSCAGSVEKAVKRLPGISQARVDVLSNRAQVLFCPSFVNVDTILVATEDCGFEATLLADDMNDNNKSVQVCRVQVKGLTCTS